MPASTEARARRRRHASIALAALVPGLVEASRVAGTGGRFDPAAFAMTTLGVLVLLAAVTASFDVATRRRLSSARAVVLTCAVAIALGVGESFAVWALAGALDLPLVMPGHRSVSVLVRMGAVNGLLGLGLWAMAVLLPFAVGEASARAREAERLRAVAELARLRANLQPHFLFNTLNTVAGLVNDDPREARRLIGVLGDLLRDSLVDADDTQTLDDEIRWLRQYADIIESRHRGSIRFTWDVADATRGVRIPRLLLQPLLENAIQHGALTRPEGGEVSVRTRMVDDTRPYVTCVVEDNGPGPAGTVRPGALGIEMVRRRLALAYDGTAEYRLESGDGRTRSIIQLPAGRP